MRIFTLNQIGRHELDVIQMAVAVEHLHEAELMRGHFRPTDGSLRVEPLMPPLCPIINSVEAKESGPFMNPRLCILLSFSYP